MIEPEVTTIFPINSEYLLWVTAKGESGNVYYVVSNKQRSEYYLFKGNKQTAKKAIHPNELYKYIK